MGSVGAEESGIPLPPPLAHEVPRAVRGAPVGTVAAACAKIEGQQTGFPGAPSAFQRPSPVPDLGTEIVQALRGMPDAIKESLRSAPPAEEAISSDKLNALAGFKFEQSLPVIKDTDFDFDRHVREFQSILDCHSFGRRGIRPYDQLTVFRKTLPAGSVRLRVPSDSNVC